MAGWLALSLTRQLASPKMLFADWPRRLLPAGHQALIASGSPRRINRFKEELCVDGRAALLVVAGTASQSGECALECCHAARPSVELYTHQMDGQPEVAVLGGVVPLSQLRQRPAASALVPRLELEQVYVAARLHCHVQPSAVAAVFNRRFDIQPRNVAVEDTGVVPLVTRDLIARVPFVGDALE